jgi:hypothetical protein
VKHYVYVEDGGWSMFRGDAMYEYEVALATPKYIFYLNKLVHLIISYPKKIWFRYPKLFYLLKTIRNKKVDDIHLFDRCILSYFVTLNLLRI